MGENLLADFKELIVQEKQKKHQREHKMKESQLKNKAQIQQIQNLKDELVKLRSKLEEVTVLLDIKTHRRVLIKIQQIDSSKMSLEDLKKGYQIEIDEVRAQIEQLRQKIGENFHLTLFIIIILLNVYYTIAQTFRAVNNS